MADRVVQRATSDQEIVERTESGRVWKYKAGEWRWRCEPADTPTDTPPDYLTTPYRSEVHDG